MQFHWTVTIENDIIIYTLWFRPVYKTPALCTSVINAAIGKVLE